MDTGFQFSHFVLGLMFPGALAAIVATVLVIMISMHRGRGNLGPIVVECILALLAGFISAAAWLSWDADTGFEGLLRYGAPVDFPQWQVASCGLTVILLSGLTTWKRAASVQETLMISLLTGFGFSMAFSLGVAFGPSTQEAVGVFFAFAGIAILTTVTNLVVWCVVSWRRERRQAE